ncbi:HD domain-containing protein [Microbacterium sp. A8/3-1]|uniref:HD domain-containing protein n=1 Tax=Microbacterium sp. A8/3-1 TaxID=3160749 RepID=A0AAU7W0P2_9MICO
MVRDLVVRARSVSQACLVALPRRWAHVQGVAAAGARVAPLVDAKRADEIVAACWLHDVGYASEIAETGFHPVDGARFAQRVGFPPLVVSLIAFHTGAAGEAAERGLSGDLAQFDAPPSEVLDVVTFADMTTAVDGAPVDAEARVAEILSRYGVGDPVHRAVSVSAPGLLASVGRVQARLAAAGASG